MKSELISVLSNIEKLIGSFAYLDSYEAMIENIKKQIDLVAENDTTGLYLFSKEENKLKLFYAKGFSEQEKQEAELTAMARHPGHVFTTGNILWVADQDKEDNPFSINSKKKSHTRSRMYVPVKANNLIIGAFGIQSERPNAFTEKNLAVLQVFAALAGNAYASIQKNLLIKKQNQENEKLSILARSTTNNVIYTDKDGKITWVNKHFEESTGYFLDEIIGKTPGSFLIGKDTDPEKTHELRTAILNKKACDTTILNYKKNGETFIVNIKLNPVFNETGDLITFVGIQEDITEVEKQKDALTYKNDQIKFREKQYNNIVNSTQDFIVTLDANGQIKFANNSWLKKMNYQLNEVIETNIFTYIHLDSQEHCMLIFNAIHNNKDESIFIKYNLINKDKVKIEVEGEVIITYKEDVIYSINSYLKDVTEINKLRIEKENKIVELKESKEKLEIVLASLSESVWGVSLPNYKLEYVSESAVSIYGYPLQNWYDNVNLWSDAIHPDDKEFVLKASEKLFDVGQFISEYRIITADKKEKWIYSDTKIITNEKGIPILMTGITKDISERKLAEIELENNSVEFKNDKDKLDLVLNSLNETIWGISLPNYNLEYISESAVALYGFPIKEWYDNTNLWIDLIHPDDKEFILKENEKLFPEGKINLEYRIITYDKKVKWISTSVKVIYNTEGIPVLIAGIAEDITHKKLVELELLNYKQAIDESAIVSITDLKGNITFVNDKFCKISQYSREELLGENHRKINSGFHPKEFFKDMWKIISSGAIWSGEIQNRAKDGTTYFVESTIIPFMKDGKPYQFVAIRYLATEKVVAKLEVVKQKEFYENILHNIPIDIAVFDHQHKYLFLNKEAIKNDETREWMLGKNDFDYGRLKNIPEKFAQERRERFNLAIQSDEEIIWLDTQTNQDEEIKYKERRFISYANKKFVIGYGVDVTAFKAQEIILSNSLKEKETLLGEIHHRVKNNLAVIDGLIQLKKITQKDELFINGLSDIAARINTISLAHQFLYQSNNFQNILFNEYIEKLCFFHKNLLRKDNLESINFQFNLDSFKLSISNCITIGLLMNELITNSIKYGFVNKSLIITIKIQLIEENIIIFYKDSGPGLSDEIKLNNKFGFGLKLIQTLTKQLKGEFKLLSSNNFEAHFNFPNLDKKSKLKLIEATKINK